MRQAIWLLMNTVGLPTITEPTPSAPLMLAAGQACWSTIVRQAGRLPIRVSGLPGPGDKGLPCVVRSVTRAASLPGTLDSAPPRHDGLSGGSTAPGSLSPASSGGFGMVPAAPPVLIRTIVPTIVTPLGSILMKPPDDLMVSSMPDSITILFPVF